MFPRGINLSTSMNSCTETRSDRFTWTTPKKVLRHYNHPQRKTLQLQRTLHAADTASVITCPLIFRGHKPRPPTSSLQDSLDLSRDYQHPHIGQLQLFNGSSCCASAGAVGRSRFLASLFFGPRIPKAFAVPPCWCSAARKRTGSTTCAVSCTFANLLFDTATDGEETANLMRT